MVLFNEFFDLVVAGLLTWRMQLRGDFDRILDKFGHYVLLYLSVRKERGIHVDLD